MTDRLVHFLEWTEYFAPYQNVFRQGRGTMDAVLVLDRDIKQVLVNKEVVVATFLDVKRAYDMPWKEGLGIKLYDAWIQGRMLNRIREFLAGCTVQVKVGGSSYNLFGDDGAIWRRGQNVEYLIKEIQEKLQLH